MPRRVGILFGVRVGVVVTMGGRPPEGAELGRGGGEHGEQKLEQAAGAEAAVREIAVVGGRHAEHADRIGGQAHQQGLATHPGPEGA